MKYVTTLNGCAFARSSTQAIQANCTSQTHLWYPTEFESHKFSILHIDEEELIGEIAFVQKIVNSKTHAIYIGRSRCRRSVRDCQCQPKFTVVTWFSIFCAKTTRTHTVIFNVIACSSGPIVLMRLQFWSNEYRNLQLHISLAIEYREMKWINVLKWKIHICIQYRIMYEYVIT